MPFHLDQCLERLATRNPGRTEADIQADVRDVLLYGGFELGDENVRLESPAPDQRRIDVEAGALVVECKRDLRPTKILVDAEVQLGGYLADRQSANQGAYVGVLTDGITWRCYRTIEHGIETVSVLELRTGLIDERRFRWWLGSLLATERQIMPTAVTIEERLGSESPGCQLAIRQLADLLASSTESSEVSLKRALWAKLLRTALGTQFEDNDALFIEHTYLVIIATLIAHIVIGFDSDELGRAPASALSGQLFARSGIRGVGEAGFFDWVLDVAGGERIVSDLARRLSVFAWTGVDHDVLKALYQSVIEPETRHRLGEYYTPDWLASRMIDSVVSEPLTSRVLDPACGSGTFLFHAIRKYFEVAERDGEPLNKAVSEVSEHVFGMDLHPVAVVLAQVTYLLAIGTNRVVEAGVPISIPVYLGDSMRWEIAEESVLAQSGEVVVSTGAGRTLFGTEDLRFPASVVVDPSRFDRLVDEMATRAAGRNRGDKPLPIGGILSNFGVSETDRLTLESTYHHFCDLHDQGRDHIWGFFVRNQSRPTWFAAAANRVDVLVGNPPWLSYRYMPEDMQTQFKIQAKERHLWSGGRVATQQDLSAFFVARSIELYLKFGGTFAFVMPLAALSRQAYSGFREGNFSSRVENCAVSFDNPWDLDKVKPDPFPVPSSVVFGKRTTDTSHLQVASMPTSRMQVAGKIEVLNDPISWKSLTWDMISAEGSANKYTKANSPYAQRFRNGATLFPRLLVLVEEEGAGPLQFKTDRSVRSRRGRLDKVPWKNLPDLTGVVEAIFLRDVYMGEQCLPFRLLAPVKAVIPFDGSVLLSGTDEKIDRYPGLASWFRTAEKVWNENKRAGTQQLFIDQLDYMHKLRAQFPLSPIRVIYTKAGNHLTAAIIADQHAVIDHKLYWGATSTIEEAQYLTAVLNAPILGEIVAPYQSRGAFGARDFDKYVWYPPIPEYDGNIKSHRLLSELGARASDVVESVDIPDGVGFQRARALIRAKLQSNGLFDEMNDQVNLILTSFKNSK